MKAKRNRRKKITREMILEKCRVISIFGEYRFPRWGGSLNGGITYDQM